MSTSAFTQIDQKMELVRARMDTSPELVNEFYTRLVFSWIYHDNALEGVVLSLPELKAAIDEEIVSDVTLIPAYEEIKNHKIAIEFVRQSGIKRKPALGLELMKKIHDILSDEPPPPRNSKLTAKTAVQYRKDNPLHRLYFHEIAPPDKISQHIRKLCQWFGTEEFRKLHPIRRAAMTHLKLIQIYPWPKHSGKVARLVMNAMLLRDGYLPAVIHAIERQRYYEVLRQAPNALTALVEESLDATIDSANKLFEFVDQQPVRAAS